MKGTKRAFTIVELVIVIAVIAVLAAVLIPTFSGIIQDANFRADQSHASSFNTAIAVEMKGKEITSDEQLKTVYDKIFGDGAYAKLQPKSADQGLHYWFDYEKQQVVLATYTEIAAMRDERDSLKQFSYVSPMANVAGTPTENDFNVLRELVNGFYFLDGSGSAFANALAKIDELGKGEANYDDVFAELNVKEKTEAVVAMANAATAKLQNTVIVTHGTTYVHENAGDTADYVFVGNVETIGAPTTETLPTPKNDTLVLPETVTSVESGALNFKEEVKGTVQVEIPESKVLDEEGNVKEESIFKAEATNVTVNVTGKADVTVTVEGSKVTVTVEGGTSTNITVNYTNLVTEFELSGSGENFTSVGSAYFIPYDKIAVGTQLTLIAENFNENATNKQVVWSVSEGAPVDFVNGVVTFKEGFAKDTKFEVVATAVGSDKDDPVSRKVSVEVVAVKNASLPFNGTTLSIDGNTDNTGNKLAITYTNTSGEAFAFGALVANNGYPAGHALNGICDATLTIAAVNVVAEDPGQNIFEIEKDADENYVLTLLKHAGTQSFTVKVGEYFEETFTVTVTDNSASNFSTKTIKDSVKMGDSYLFRVGNKNAIKLSTLFELDGDKPGTFSVSIKDSVSDRTIAESKDKAPTSGFYATYTKNDNYWGDGTIQFGGTGVAIIEIKNGAGSATLAVEVLDGKNITKADQSISGANAYMLLESIDRTIGFSLSGGQAFYGNGFAINATTYKVSAGSSNWQFINLSSGALLDNVILNGPVYPTIDYSANSNGYYVWGVNISGATITNSYISGFRMPVRASSGDNLIKNTTLEGGVYANLEATGGNLTLEDVTTIQMMKQATVGDTSKKVIGVGIVFDKSATANSDLVLKGYLRQYNWVPQSATSLLDSTYRTAVNALFTSLTEYVHEANGEKYLLVGIVFMAERTTIDDNRTDSEKAARPYSAETQSGLTCFSIKSKYVPVSEVTYTGTYLPNTQSAFKPVFTFTPKYDSAPVENTKISHTGKTVEIGIPLGGTYTWNLSNGVAFAKYGVTIDVTKILIDGEEFNSETKAFTTKGKYTVTYVIQDMVTFNAAGNLETEEVEYEYEVTVEVKYTTIPDAQVTLGAASKVVVYRKIGGWQALYDPDYAGCVPINDSITVTDYDEATGAFKTVTYAAADIVNSGKFTITATGHYFESNGFSLKKYNNHPYLLEDKYADDPDAATVTVTYTYTGSNGKTVSVKQSFTLTTSTTAVANNKVTDWS